MSFSKCWMQPLGNGTHQQLPNVLPTSLAQRRCDRVLGSVIHGDSNIYLDEYRPILQAVPGFDAAIHRRRVAVYRLAIVGRISETTFPKHHELSVLEHRTEDTGRFMGAAIPGECIDMGEPCMGLPAGVARSSGSDTSYHAP